MSGTEVTLSATEARVVLARGSKSFSFASFFLPADCRDDAAKVYAFCRAVDDLVDERTNDETAARSLRQLEDELRGHVLPGPTVAAYLGVATTRGFGIAPALELIEGVRSDLGRVRIEDDAQLLRYCYRVAGTVGLMMSGVIGVRDPAASVFAIDLGVAMQLTNICRDVLEDAQRGRVYLPGRRLVAHGLDPERLLEHTVDRSAVASVVRELLVLAERYYDSGMAGLRFIPTRPRFAIALAARIYRAIGRKLLRQGGDPLHGRTVVSWPEKLGQLSISIFGLLDPSHWGVVRAHRHDAGLHEPLLGLPGTNASSRGPG